MSYASIDQLQTTLSTTVFHHKKDAKKAAGRALGTLVEIISYYLMRKWELGDNILIERPLPEYGNSEITHNVEFSFHPATNVQTINMCNWPVTSSRIIRQMGDVITPQAKKTNTLVTKDGLLRNACVFAQEQDSVYTANINDSDCQTIKILHLLNKPFAMVECKRVGVEEGTKKGPQTIEKAKQGAYVARMTSSLQKVRDENGNVYGLIYHDDVPVIKPYSVLLDEIVNGQDRLLKDFILSIGIVSNHGNWFTGANLNKELKVLAQSYDWLLFLTDQGLAQFITDLLLSPAKQYECIRDAFTKSYQEGKKQNLFTKTKIDIKAHLALIEYFNNNISQIEGWFNMITPNGLSIQDLKRLLLVLKNKNWEAIL